jgi:hypothetical protein
LLVLLASGDFHKALRSAPVAFRRCRERCWRKQGFMKR